MIYTELFDSLTYIFGTILLQFSYYTPGYICNSLDLSRREFLFQYFNNLVPFHLIKFGNIFGILYIKCTSPSGFNLAITPLDTFVTLWIFLVKSLYFNVLTTNI